MTQKTETLFSRPKPQISPEMLGGILSAPTTTPPAPQRPDDKGDPRVDAAVAFARGRPQITTYAPVASAVLEYLVRTVPGVNKSAVCAAAIERALQEDYPDIWATVCERVAAEPHRKKTYAPRRAS